MDLTCAWAALRVALASTWDSLGYLAFLQILMQFLRQDIVGVDNQTRITTTADLLSAYDYVIVGGGSAGAVVASRLSENASCTVLLLEAGDSPQEITDVPALAVLFPGTHIDWGFDLEPSTTACLGEDNHVCRRTTGKVLGGTDIINYMMFVRGNKNDFDHWKELGNDGWGYDQVLPYFIKMENVSIPNLRDSPYRGKEGYLTIEEPRYRVPLADKYLEAAIEMGYPLIDYNGKSQLGFSYLQNTLRDGLRCSTEKAFLGPASRRKNLHVRTGSMVTKVLIDPITKATYGVIAIIGGVQHTFYSNKEVILSAGSIQSPQLLMLSGIGPKEQLEKFGIEVIHDLPGVGQNYQDHSGVSGLLYSYDGLSNSTESTPSGLVSEPTIKQFLEEKDGPLYGFVGGEAQGFVHTGMTNDSLDHPDIQMIIISIGETAFSILPILQRPKSRGNLTLRSGDPYDPPVIHANLLGEKFDVDVLVKGAQMAHTITQTEVMKKLNAQPNPAAIPACGSFNASSPTYLECHMRHSTFQGQHAVGTCKMGVATDPMAVVDPQLRVYGVTGLRVIDGSIMPQITSGNTNAPIIMIGERGSDLVKADLAAGVKQCVVAQSPRTKNRRGRKLRDLITLRKLARSHNLLSKLSH